MKSLKSALILLGVMIVAIIVTGILLDIMDQGIFGPQLQAIAKKATNGYSTGL